MPKVKFSALVTDMKGKANGSVFASNNGGSYFRTNKYGGGRKSADWNTNKNKFADVSSQWKSLTDEQQQAWVDARSLYPTTNAFGESRLPTSFELYMRLNSTLKASNLPTLLTPEAPRSMPQDSVVEIIIPDMDLFAPKIVTKTIAPGNRPISLVSELTSSQTDPLLTQSLSCRFIMPKNLNSIWVPGNTYQLLNFLTSPTAGGVCFMTIANNSTANFFLTMPFIKDGGGARTYVAEYAVPRSYLTKQIHVIAQFDSRNLDKNKLYINGIQFVPTIKGVTTTVTVSPRGIEGATIDTTIPATDPSAAAARTLVIGALDNDYHAPFDVSDFRMYANNDLEGSCGLGVTCPDGYICRNGCCVERNSFMANGPDEIDCYDGIDETACLEGQFCLDGVCVDGEVYDSAFSPVDILNINSGYIIGGETIAVSFTRANRAPAGDYAVGRLIFPNESTSNNYGDFYMVQNYQWPSCDECVGNDFECQDGECVYVGDKTNVLSRNTLSYGPLATLKTSVPDDHGFYVQIYFSKLMSAGKSVTQIPYVSLGSFCMCGGGANLTAKMMDIVGNFPNNGTFAFECKIMDGTTGLVYDTLVPLAKPVKKKVKFKAAAELSGKVN